MDLVDEVRNEAMKRMEKYKGTMARYQNKKVKVKRFNIGDLEKSHKQQRTHPKGS